MTTTTATPAGQPTTVYEKALADVPGKKFKKCHGRGDA